MIENIYIEEEIFDHPRTRKIVSRYPNASIIKCERYGNVFNSNAQNFRIQKKQPSLILAKKNSGRILETPVGYGIGGTNNYYFSHMLNCLYDCRYCFLQGMYRSAHYVVFVNYEDFLDDITQLSNQTTEPAWFFSGYDCDSLGMEPVTEFMSYALQKFSNLGNAHLEIRTKSTQIRTLLNHEAFDNCVVAYSFTPAKIANALEHKVPSFNKRVNSAEKLQKLGWNIGLRLDPIIYTDTFESDYSGMLQTIFAKLDARKIHSVSYGPFRLPRDFFKKMVKLYPREKLFAGPLTENGKLVSYEKDLEEKCQHFLNSELLKYIDQSQIFPCS